MTERKRKLAEERAYVNMVIELTEQEIWLRNFRLTGDLIPDDWHKIEAEVPVRPYKTKLTAAFDTEVVKWYRKMGHGYQARMNAVLRAYMLAMKSREIVSYKDRDWKGDEI